ncbi:hypothetical protein V5799_019056 [Amblyomma americanum]|uniref:Uncharacterized protein n=1 Tax=Amblyomma americanum TaxID=6943 RepID=A0AAQ4EXY0_AMBAM
MLVPSKLDETKAMQLVLRSTAKSRSAETAPLPAPNDPLEPPQNPLLKPSLNPPPDDPPIPPSEPPPKTVPCPPNCGPLVQVHTVDRMSSTIYSFHLATDD